MSFDGFVGCHNGRPRRHELWGYGPDKSSAVDRGLKFHSYTGSNLHANWRFKTKTHSRKACPYEEGGNNHSTLALPSREDGTKLAAFLHCVLSLESSRTEAN